MMKAISLVSNREWFIKQKAPMGFSMQHNLLRQLLPTAFEGSTQQRNKLEYSGCEN
jgi:hypothetical protein